MHGIFRPSLSLILCLSLSILDNDTLHALSWIDQVFLYVSNSLKISINKACVQLLYYKEFIPYSFQLLSLMIEFHNGTLPSVYCELFPFLLMPVLWERFGYIPALVNLLQSYINKAYASIAQEKIVSFHFFQVNKNIWNKFKIKLICRTL